MDGSTLSYGGVVKLTAEAAKENHREFKAFGLVNGHYSYSILIFTGHLDLPHGHLLFLYSIDITHESV